jgi:hypothetical protein
MVKQSRSSSFSLVLNMMGIRFPLLPARDPGSAVAASAADANARCEFSGLPLGELARKGEKGVTLTVGNQRLDGKIVECKQPIAVMSRQDGGGDDNGAGAGYSIKGFIRRKVVFLHR